MARMTQQEKELQPVEKVGRKSIEMLVATIGTLLIWFIAFSLTAMLVGGKGDSYAAWLGLAVCFSASMQLNAVVVQKPLSKDSYKGVLIATLVMYVPLLLLNLIIPE